MFLKLNQMPFYNSESGGLGKTGQEEADIKGKGKTNESDDVYAEIVKKVDDARKKVLSTEGEEGAKPEKPASEEKPAEQTIKIEGQQVIDDKYIAESARNELFKELDNSEVNKILNSIKGNQVDAKILKNYVHAQVKLVELQKSNGHKPEEKTTEENFENIAERTEEDYENNLSQLDTKEVEKLNQAKRSALYNQLKAKYKDITPEDLADDDSLNEYVSGLMVNKPLLASDFKDDYRNANKSIDKETNEFVDRSLNFGDYMKKDAIEMVNKFNTMLTSRGIDPKSLEADLTEKWIIQNIIKKEDGKLNTDLIGYYRNNTGIPILKKAEFYQALVDKFDSRIAELTKKAGIQEFIDGKRKKEANPSISTSGAGARTKVELEPGDVIPTKEFVGFEQIEATLAKNRKKILENPESVY